jgi:hypothetical protein
MHCWISVNGSDLNKCERIRDHPIAIGRAIALQPKTLAPINPNRSSKFWRQQAISPLPPTHHRPTARGGATLARRRHRRCPPISIFCSRTSIGTLIYEDGTIANVLTRFIPKSERCPGLPAARSGRTAMVRNSGVTSALQAPRSLASTPRDPGEYWLSHLEPADTGNTKSSTGGGLPKSAREYWRQFGLCWDGLRSSMWLNRWVFRLQFIPEPSVNFPSADMPIRTDPSAHPPCAAILLGGREDRADRLGPPHREPLSTRARRPNHCQRGLLASVTARARKGGGLGPRGGGNWWAEFQSRSPVRYVYLFPFYFPFPFLYSQIQFKFRIWIQTCA